MRVCLLLGVLCAFAAGPALAEPWLAPGDDWVRADLQRLVDAGVIESPLMAWPLSWGDLAGDLQRSHRGALPADAEAALVRVRSLMRDNLRTGIVNGRAELRLDSSPVGIRAAHDTPRGEFESWASLDWTGNRFALKLRGGFVNNDPLDNREFRPDGTYAGVALGNWMLSAGWQERYWGPGVSGSLVLGNAARPLPAITLQRNQTQPFENRWLSWMGPWGLTVFHGWLESERDVDNARLLGGRFSFRPTSSLEIGVSRTAQWCGDGRPCDFQSLRRLAVGFSNRGADGITEENEPGNQLAGFDARWQSPVGELPYAVYGQLIGEDEAGYMPSKYLGLVGVEAWGHSQRLGAGVRVNVEMSDTTCRFWKPDSDFRCAYRHRIYTDGYRFRGRPIAHGTDSDAQVFTAMVTVREEAGRDWRLSVRHGRLNRGTPADDTNTITPDSSRFSDVQLAARQDTRFGRITAEIGYERFANRGIDSRDDNNLRASLTWQRAF